MPISLRAAFGAWGNDRTRIANILRRRGHTINGAITKTYRRAPA